MSPDPSLPNRRSIRLAGYDYSQAGAYFVTICTQDRQCLLGDFVGARLDLNPAGQLVKDVWETLPSRFSNLALDAFTVMPNHVHAILILTSLPEPADQSEHPSRAPAQCVCDQTQWSHLTRDPPVPAYPAPHGTDSGTVGRVVQAFKSLTTHAYALNVSNLHWQPFPGRLWHRNYYERIIRDQRELEAIRQYIWDNPVRWPLDVEHP
jgi:putative transposase